MFAKTKSTFQERNAIFFSEIITCNPSIFSTMDHPDLPVSNFMENSIGLKSIKTQYIVLNKLFSMPHGVLITIQLTKGELEAM